MRYWRTNHIKNKNSDNVTVATPAADKLIDEILGYLVYEKEWRVVAHDTHRWIDSDGWYELEFELRSQDGIEDVYLHTHSTHDRDFEEEWSREGDTDVEISDIYWDDKDDWDSKYAMVMISGNNKAWKDLTTELRKKVETLLCSDPDPFWKNSITKTVEGGKMGLKKKIRRRLDEVCTNRKGKLELPGPLENKSDSDLRCEYFALTWAYEHTSDPLVKDIYKETADELADELTRRGIRVVRPGEKNQACGSDLIRNWHSKIDKLQEYLDLYSQNLALIENRIAELSVKSVPGPQQPDEPENIRNETAEIKELTAMISTDLLPQQEFCDKVNRLAAMEPRIDKIVWLPWIPLLKQLRKLLADMQHLMIRHPEVFPKSENAEYIAAVAELADVLERSLNNGGKND